MTTLVLVPSPMLGPAVWAPVASRLMAEGWTVVQTGSRAAGPTSTPADVLAGLLTELPDEPDLVLVLHSNAGLYLPALTEQRRVAAAVLVDAGLPPEEGEVATAPAHFLDHLRSLAGSDGLLPPWTGWWDDIDVAGIFPNRSARAAVEAEQPRLPLSYFTATVPVPAGWRATPCAYLSFGETYADDRDRAGDLGWPVERLPGDHLHMLVDPPSVTRSLTRLLEALDVRLERG